MCYHIKKSESYYFMSNKKIFLKGFTDGIPICLGYLSVGFAFGIFAVESGLSVLESLFISMTNVTSAGQLAGVPIITGGGTLIELAITQFIINLRYSLMSVSLSQKFDKTVRFSDRFPFAFINTDEVFAVAVNKQGKVGRTYMYGLIIPPFLGWSLGTLLGAAAGNIFPAVIISALGVAIYGMFIAILIPQAKSSRACFWCIILSVALGCIFKYLPLLNTVPQGFVIIICAVAASTIFAIIAPVEMGAKGNEC